METIELSEGVALLIVVALILILTFNVVDLIIDKIKNKKSEKKKTKKKKEDNKKQDKKKQEKSDIEKASRKIEEMLDKIDEEEKIHK